MEERLETGSIKHNSTKKRKENTRGFGDNVGDRKRWKC